MPAAHFLPVLTGNKDFRTAFCGLGHAGFDGFGIVMPDVLHGLRHDRGRVFAVVAALAPGVGDFVSRPLQRAVHRLVGHPPVAAVNVEVVAAVLHEDADRLWFKLADECRVLMPAAQTDVRADCADDAAERVRSFPRRGESTDGSRTGTRDRAVVRVLADVPVL